MPIPAPAPVQVDAPVPPWDVTTLLHRALLLQQSALVTHIPPLLRGRHLALWCEPPAVEGPGMFRRAAEELGAHVAVLRVGLSTHSAWQEVRDTARLLGRLYDAVECQGPDPALIRRLVEQAGIPMFEGAALPGHPVAQLADLLPTDRASPADNRRFVLQALLLEALG